MWTLSMGKKKQKKPLSFRSSSFETVVRMLKRIIIYSITESRATAVPDVSDLD